MPPSCPIGPTGSHQVCPMVAPCGYLGFGPGWPQGLPHVLPRFAHGWPQICYRFAAGLPHVCYRFAPGLPGLVSGLPQVCYRFAPGDFTGSPTKTNTKNTKNLSKHPRVCTKLSKSTLTCTMLFHMFAPPLPQVSPIFTPVLPQVCLIFCSPLPHLCPRSGLSQVCHR